MIDQNTIDSAYREQRTIVGSAIGAKQAELHGRWALQDFRNPAVARSELRKTFEESVDAAVKALTRVHFLAGDEDVSNITSRLQTFVNDTPLARTAADQTPRDLAHSLAEFDGLRTMMAGRLRDQTVVALQEFRAEGRVERPRENRTRAQTGKIVIGHGHSPIWLEVREFLRGRLGLPVEEFNSVAVAGLSNKERLNQMREVAGMAFLVMTAEDEQAGGEVRARQNVIHEIGFFQGALGFERAIILLEEGCQRFSNVEGISDIRFPKGQVSAAYEEIRRTLEREGLLPL